MRPRTGSVRAGSDAKIPMNEKNMTERLGTMLTALPNSALHAMTEDSSGRLKEMVVLLVQLVEAYQGLLQDSDALAATPKDDAEAEWQGRAEALLIHAEYVLTGQARVPKTDGVANRDNVVAMSSRLRQAMLDNDTVDPEIPKTPGRVVPIGDHVLQ